MRFHIITLFPASIEGYIQHSILKRAIADKKISVNFYDPKDFEPNKKLRIDGKPYGGGPGMVMRPEPVISAVKKAIGRRNPSKVCIIMLSPQGKQFTNTDAINFSRKFTDIVILAGRYEGIDARVSKIFKAKHYSIGPFVLAGGELPAMMMTEIIARHIPNVLGNDESLEEERVASRDVFTRPEILVHKKKKYRVPKVLLSGNHKKIDEWRKKN